MNIIDRCSTMLKELSNSKGDFLPLHNQEIVSECLTSIRKLFEENQKEALEQSTSEIQSSQDGLIVVKIRHSIILFIKRCLIAYQ